MIILAAIILIPGLALDPFTQQLIRPFDCSTPLTHEDATLPRTNRIDSHLSPGKEGRVSAQVLRSALVQGLSFSSHEISWECSTGNCTFPDIYSTLGICSACEDLSSEAVFETTPWDPSESCDGQTSTTYLPNGDKLEGHYWGDDYDQLNMSFSKSCKLDQTGVAHMDIWLPLSSDAFPLRLDIIVGKTTYSEAGRLISTGKPIKSCDKAEANDTWACRGYGAARCILKPCVRTYVEAAYLIERLVSQSPDVTWGPSWLPNYYGLLDSHCMLAQEAGFLKDRGYEMDNTTRWIPFDGDLNNNNSFLDNETTID